MSLGLRLRLFIIMVLLSSSAMSQPKDTLYFYNKTKIVGELLSIKLGRFEFDADGIGIIKIKNNKVTSMNATSRSFRVEALDGHEVKGSLARSYNPGMVYVYSTPDTMEWAIADVANLVYYGRKLRNRITGNVSAGWTYTKSSSVGRLNLDGAIKYNTARGQTEINGDLITTYDSIKYSTERADVVFSHEHTFAPQWGAVFFLKYQRNLELGLQRRWQQALGVGREFILNRHQQMVVIGGAATNQEINLEQAEQSSIEALLQIDYDLFSFASPNITVSFVESAFFGLSDSERIRLDGDFNVDYELFSDFYISMQVYHNYDSRSPATNEPNIDYGFVGGLRYKF